MPRPVHPGVILAEEFLKPLGITQRELAAHLGQSTVQVNKIVKGKRSVTVETAWLLAEALGTTPQYWVELQVKYDLATRGPPYHVERIRKAS